jgi:hypothetical protein
MKKLRTLLPLMVVLLFAFTSILNAWGAPPLPAVPDSSVINAVLSQTNGAVFTPISPPYVVSQQLSQLGGVFDGIEGMVSTSQAVHYITSAGALAESVLPLHHSSSETLTPTISTPGDNQPAKIVGATFLPHKGTAAVIAVFKNGKHKETRFYYDDVNYEVYPMYKAKFPAAPGQEDEGAVIAHGFSCVTVGIDQVCWQPPAMRDDHFGFIKQLVKDFGSTYKFMGNFHTAEALPDIIGSTQRSACSAQLSGATDFGHLPACVPNLVFTSAKKYRTGNPFAIFSLTQPANIQTFAQDGSYIGDLPAGQYLVVDATPDKPAGQPGVLFLINIDQTNHYLIPSTAMQGFGNGVNKLLPGIKDGFAHYRRW